VDYFGFGGTGQHPHCFAIRIEVELLLFQEHHFAHPQPVSNRVRINA